MYSLLIDMALYIIKLEKCYVSLEKTLHTIKCSGMHYCP
jgi:hypothetical protein